MGAAQYESLQSLDKKGAHPYTNAHFCSYDSNRTPYSSSKPADIDSDQFALSRATCQEVLQISRFDPKKVLVHTRVREFYDGLERAPYEDASFCSYNSENTPYSSSKLVNIDSDQFGIDEEEEMAMRAQE